MSVIATALKHLMAAGVTGDALVAAVADMEAAIPKDAAAERRRAWDRERKRRLKAEAQAGGIPVDSAETADGAEPPAPALSPQTPQTHPHPENNHARVRGLEKPADVSDQTWGDFLKHRKRIKADATPTAISRIRKQAEEAGWSMEDALAELVSRGWRGFSADWVKAAFKSGNVTPIDPVVAAEQAASLYRRMGRDEDAKEAEQRAARLRAGPSGPTRSIGEIVNAIR